MVTWKTVQQIIRIVGYAAAGVAFGLGWIDQNTLLQLLGGGGFAALVAWWAAFNTTIKQVK